MHAPCMRASVRVHDYGVLGGGARVIGVHLPAVSLVRERRTPLLAWMWTCNKGERRGMDFLEMVE